MTTEIQDRLNKITAMLRQSVETVQVHNNGDDFLVVEVNHTWMFRFPRNESARQALICEMAFLPEFASRSPLPVPRYTFVGEDFVGYRKIEGMLLTRSLFETLDDEMRHLIQPTRMAMLPDSPTLIGWHEVSMESAQLPLLP